MGAPEAALRLMARRGRGDWMAIVVGPGADVAGAAEELAEEMEALADGAVVRVRDAGTVEALAERLAATQDPTVVCGLDAWSVEDWGHFDRLRSRFMREERTALVLGRAAFERLAQAAPNFSSWLGASLATYQPDASVLTDEERARRLEALHTWSGLSNDEVLARAEAGTLPADPEFAEWLVLLQRGELLGR